MGVRPGREIGEYEANTGLPLLAVTEGEVVAVVDTEISHVLLRTNSPCAAGWAEGLIQSCQVLLTLKIHCPQRRHQDRTSEIRTNSENLGHTSCFHSNSFS